jgi:hypothetical protein
MNYFASQRKIWAMKIERKSDEKIKCVKTELIVGCSV